MKNTRHDYDLIVIGGGSAGLTAARFARQLGLSVALVEKSRIGGDCTWTGCVPSKALLKAADVAHEMRNAGHYGLPEQRPDIDLEPVMSRVKAVIGRIYHAESLDSLRSEGIDVVIGPARFQDSRTISVDGRELTARRFLICTGASPAVPPIPGMETVGYLTYETVWDLAVLPGRLAIVGAGPIGCELAQAFNRFGSSVTLVEAADRVLPQDDPETSEVIGRVLAEEGVDVRVGNGLASAEKVPDGVRLSLAGGGQVEAEAVLLSVGRRANLEGLRLESAGVGHDHRGITVTQHLRTNQRNIYAAGDCIGGYQFTHYAAYQGFLAVRNAFLPLNQRAVLPYVPWATFTDPEAAQVGLTEAQARERHGDSVTAGRFPLSKVDRAATDGATDGFIKLVYRPNGRLLGATVVAPHAGEMIHEFAVALDRRLKLADLARTIHVYPTYGTGVQQLATDLTVERMLSGRVGRLARKLARWGR